ncbi:hypothetical protein ACH5RR_009015 [Cinchona calisaya]|uniref:Beta-glucosidase n=1 Tax=Cinchona calisaya TaxID=153742 RepID=A0ABD3ADR2_9GENT
MLGTFAPGRHFTNEVQRRAIAEVLPSSLGTSTEAMAHSHTPSAGDPKTEPYIVTHNQLLAHAAAVKIYRRVYQNAQKGKIGIGLVTIWTEPHTDTQADRDAAQRVFDPVVFGKYPESMRRLLGSQLPEFTPHQIRDLAGSFDFIGMNYYTSNTNSTMDAKKANLVGDYSKTVDSENMTVVALAKYEVQYAGPITRSKAKTSAQ